MLLGNYMVLGFAFNEGRDQVLLIEKNKPDWQKGLLNGIGGKMEQRDYEYEDFEPHLQPFDRAMIREFREETGIMIHPKQLRRFGRMAGRNDHDGWLVFLYDIHLGEPQFQNARTQESEKVEAYFVAEIMQTAGRGKTIDNIPMLLQAALLTNINRLEIRY